MQERGILKEHFPKNLLVAWILVSVACIVMMFFSLGNFFNTEIRGIIENILTVVSLGLYIKCFTLYIAQERELFHFHTETLFRKRVDEAIRERDIQRAAEMLRESENKETPQSENSQAD